VFWLLRSTLFVAGELEKMVFLMRDSVGGGLHCQQWTRPYPSSQWTAEWQAGQGGGKAGGGLELFSLVENFREISTADIFFSRLIFLDFG
jgi:hypothetical protein